MNHLIFKRVPEQTLTRTNAKQNNRGSKRLAHNTTQHNGEKKRRQSEAEKSESLRAGNKNDQTPESMMALLKT